LYICTEAFTSFYSSSFDSYILKHSTATFIILALFFLSVILTFKCCYNNCFFFNFYVFVINFFDTYLYTYIFALNVFSYKMLSVKLQISNCVFTHNMIYEALSSRRAIAGPLSKPKNRTSRAYNIVHDIIYYIIVTTTSIL